MERDKLFQDIGKFAEALGYRGVSLRDLKGTARAMTKGAQGASLEDLREAKRELTILERTLRRREAKGRAQIFDLRERIGMAIFCGVFGGAILDKTFADPLGEEEAAQVIATVDIPEPAGERPEGEEISPPRIAAVSLRAPTHIGAKQSPSESTIFETPRYLLGTPRIKIPPIHQELGMLDRARFPETNEHGYIAILLAGRRGIGQPEGGPLLDSMKEIIIDPKTGRAIIINLPRDLAVQYQNGRGRTFQNKLNTVHQNAGQEVLNRVVTEITGQPMTHFVVIDFQEMEALSREFLEILGGRIIVEDPHGRHFWSDYAYRYYPPRFELTTPEAVHDYVGFRRGYEVKPNYGERVAASGLSIPIGPFPKPRADEIVRKVGSSDGRCDRQSIFLQALFANLRGINIFNIPDLVSFARDHFGISMTEQAKFALLQGKMQLPHAVPTKWWSQPLPNDNGPIRKSTVAIDPNRIRREIQLYLQPSSPSELSAVFPAKTNSPAPLPRFASAVLAPRKYGSSHIPHRTQHR